MALAYLGLGSNLGDREANLAAAEARIASVPGVRVVKKSSIAETDPVDYLDQPRFLNRVVVIETTMAPLDLLAELKRAEEELGRVRSVPKGPRSIDLDILLYDGAIIATAVLTIPHPEIKNRPFVLRHLVEVAPDLADPLTGTRYRDLV
jgi:2-amino-4-hydroxy-6-hydroxymethyldihydropteridine diphosphokinase